MARVLPPHPDLDHLKNEAKALLKADRKARGFCYADVRCLPCTVPTE